MALWGSGINTKRFRVLGDRFSRLFIWLDKDKARYAVSAGERARPFFNEVRVIVTEKDPKEYSDEEIKRILNL